MTRQPTVNESEWTTLKLLNWAGSYFESRHVEGPRASAEVLLAHALNVERIQLYMKYDQPLNSDELARFKTLLKRRALFEPVAYITGSREFWSLDFNVTPHVLIPRPETECLVETTLFFLRPPIEKEPEPEKEPTPEKEPDPEKKSESEKKPAPEKRLEIQEKTGPTKRILDLGTGSGAIIISLASDLTSSASISLRPSSSDLGALDSAPCPRDQSRYIFFASDRSFDALKIASMNASRHGLEHAIHFFSGDWLDAVKPEAGFDLIVSNPPYIQTDGLERLAPDIRLHEPRLALDGSGDGLFSVRRIIQAASDFLKPGGMLAMEIGYDQKASALKIAESWDQYKDIVCSKDYAGNDRIIRMIKR